MDGDWNLCLYGLTFLNNNRMRLSEVCGASHVYFTVYKVR